MGEPLRELPQWKPLAEYLGNVQHNLTGPIPAVVTYADDMLGHFLKNLHNSQGLRSLSLFNYSYGSWRASTLLTLAGATPQVPTLHRHALEAALYGYLFKFDGEMKRLWERRHESNSIKSKFRNGGLPKAKKILSDKDPALSASIFDFYDHLIDFGGHPNVLALESLTEYVIEDGASHGGVVFQMLSGQEERVTANTHCVALAIMIASLARYVWPTRFDILGIQGRLDRIRHEASVYVHLWSKTI